MNTNRSITKQDLLILFAVLLLVAAGYFSYQIYTDAEAAFAQTDIIQAEIDTKAAELTRVQVLSVQQDELKADYEKKSAMFGKGPEEDLIMEELQSIAENNGCELLSVSFGEITDNSDHKQMNMTVSLRGEYSELAQMLMTIHEDGRYYRVTNLGFSASEAEELEISIGLLSFYL